MTYRGHVKDGQIALDEPAGLPEGVEVKVEIVENGSAEFLRHRRTRRIRLDPDLARQIASLEATGVSHRTLDLQLKKLREVTPEQVREVARKYFRDDHLTVATLDPQPLEGARRAKPPVGLRHVQ